jgi:hypothetical protein
MWDDALTSAANAGPIRPPLVIGCGALARELVDLTRRAGLPPMDLTCLPASLHNRPERIPGAVAARIRRARHDGYDRIFVAYADCGTGGLLDRVLDAEGVARLEGAHCYEVYAGRAAFAALHDEEPGTFYLTDFLVRNFERLVVRGLGLDRHPELLPIYFGNYRRLVYLAQLDDAELAERAAAAAETLGLSFERRLVRLGELASAVATFAARTPHETRPRLTPGVRKRRQVPAPTPKRVDFLPQEHDLGAVDRGNARRIHATYERRPRARRSIGLLPGRKHEPSPIPPVYELGPSRRDRSGAAA